MRDLPPAPEAPCPGVNPRHYPITMANHCPGCGTDPCRRDAPEHNIGFHGLEGFDAPNPHGPPGMMQLGRNLEWSNAIARTLALHCNNVPPEVALDAIGMLAALLATGLIDCDTEPVQSEMHVVLTNVAERIFHHDPLHALLGVATLCSCTVAKYVVDHYPARDPSGMH